MASYAYNASIESYLSDTLSLISNITLFEMQLNSLYAFTILDHRVCVHIPLEYINIEGDNICFGSYRIGLLVPLDNKMQMNVGDIYAAFECKYRHDESINMTYLKHMIQRMNGLVYQDFFYMKVV